MAITYRIDEANFVVRTTATGRLNDEELLAHKSALLADPKFRPGMKELSDIRRVEHLEVTPRGVAAAASFDSANQADFESHKLGLLVPSDLVFGMARMYEMKTEGNTGGVEVFRTEEEANAWLGLPSSEAEDQG